MAGKRKKPVPKRGASRYKAPTKPPVPVWIWLVCALLVGAFVIFLTQLQPGSEEIRRKPPQAEQKPAAPKPAEAAKPKYDFYTLLPESKVEMPAGATPPEQKPPVTAPVITPEQDAERALALLEGREPVAASTAAKPSEAVAGKRHFLQAGSFRKQNDAEQLRARLILLGQSAQVETGTVREETWYRVLVGPFSTREQLVSAQKSLTASGYKNLLPVQR